MPNVTQFEKPNPYQGEFIICLKDDPSQIIERKSISTQEEFRTILDGVIKYNNALGNMGPQLRKLIKAE